LSTVLVLACFRRVAAVAALGGVFLACGGPVGLGAALAPASAQAVPAEPGSPTEPPPPPVPDPRISPSLVAVPVDSPAYRSAVARYRDAEARLASARQTFAEAEQTLGLLHGAEARLVGESNEASRKRAKSDARVTELRASVRGFAVASYMAGGIGDPVSVSLDLDEINDRTRERVLADTASEQRFAELRAHTDQVRRMESVLTQVGADLSDVGRRLDETEAVRDAAGRDGAQASADLVRFGQQVADARLEAEVIGLDFSFVVLDAYVKAATVLFLERPACALRWSALAAIGRTESGHGTFGGAVVQASGDVTRAIIGIRLDGTNGTAVITDSDGGALDGDIEFDRAVGPMQFIPTSWRTLGRDGNGDDRADPQNMYDSALAAANLLCRSGPLDGDAGLRAAFLRYNNSQAYATQVLERTRGYDAFVIPSPSP
jgi:membrane-bound lytic murein transglycosylase B